MRPVGEALQMTDIEIPAIPHMPAEAVQWLTAKLRTVRSYLEFGSGGSTRLAAGLGVPRIVSIESDPGYAEAVRKAAVSPASDITVIHVDIGPVKEWGSPRDSSRRDYWPEYPNAGWSAFAGKPSPDLVLIDGRFRPACFLLSLLRSAPGTNIMFDDYVNRDHYKFVEAFVSPIELFGRTALFETPAVLDEAAIQQELVSAYFRPA